MERFIQIICDLLGDIGCTDAIDILQKEFAQCVASLSQEEQRESTQQFVAQLKVVIRECDDTENKYTQTEDDARPSKRQKTDNVQVNASKQELDKRISGFIASKRLENDLSNQQEFCGSSGDKVSARTDVAEIKRKLQIKYSRVVNEAGEVTQTQSSTDDPLTSTHTNSASEKLAAGKLVQLPWGVEERLRNLEHYMSIPNIPPRPVPSDVYARLKQVEERVLDIEAQQLLQQQQQQQLLQQSQQQQQPQQSQVQRQQQLPQNVQSQQQMKQLQPAQQPYSPPPPPISPISSPSSIDDFQTSPPQLQSTPTTEAILQQYLTTNVPSPTTNNNHNNTNNNNNANTNNNSSMTPHERRIAELTAHLYQEQLKKRSQM